jgi:hypothetical protein
MARKAAVALAARSRIEVEQDRPEVAVVHDAVEVFAKRGEAFLSSAELVAALCELPEADWGAERRPLTQRRLANLLARHGVKVDQPGHRGPRGYHRGELERVRERLAPAGTRQSDATDATDAAARAQCVASSLASLVAGWGEGTDAPDPEAPEADASDASDASDAAPADGAPLASVHRLIWGREEEPEEDPRALPRVTPKASPVDPAWIGRPCAAATFREHQSRHRQLAEGWLCPPCNGGEGAP